MARQKHTYDYTIDGRGDWCCEGNPVTDPVLFRTLSRSLFEKGGRFFIRCEGEVHPVRVEDAPLWVRNVHAAEGPDGELLRVEIELQDGRREELKAETLSVAGESALYCLATSMFMKARFGKYAYYEITRYLRCDPDGAFYFTIGGKRYPITPTEH